MIILKSFSGKTVCRGGTSGASMGTGSCMVAAGGTDNVARGKEIKDPEDVLGKGRDKMGGVDPGVERRNTACPKSLNGSDILNISFRSPNESDRVEKSSMGIDTSGSSYSPSNINTTWGQREFSVFIVICTINSTKQRTLRIIGLAMLISLDQIYAAGGSLEGSEPVGEPKPCSSSCSYLTTRAPSPP